MVGWVDWPCRVWGSGAGCAQHPRKADPLLVWYRVSPLVGDPVPVNEEFLQVGGLGIWRLAVCGGRAIFGAVLGEGGSEVQNAGEIGCLQHDRFGGLGRALDVRHRAFFRRMKSVGRTSGQAVEE